MKDLAIYGAGGLGREVACLIGRINEAANEPMWNLVGFFDDGKPAGTAVSHFGKVLGGIDELNAWHSPLSIAVAIGKPQTVKAIVDKISNDNINFPNLVDPTFSIADTRTFSVGKGNIIQANCWVSCDVAIGDFNLLNGYINLGHDITIGDFNAIMPSVCISGKVSIGSLNLFAVSSAVLQQVKIGTGVTLSPGSILLSRPKDNSTYIGNPATLFRY